MTYRLKVEEQETTVSISRDTNIACIYTSDRRYMRKLDKLCETAPESYQCIWVDTNILGDGLPMGKRYHAPAKLVRFARPVVRTPEQIEAARERGKQNAERLSILRRRNTEEQQ